MTNSILTTYLAGFLTSLTPCVYPMIPLSLGYLGSRSGNSKKATVLYFSAGQVLMFSLMGFAAVQLGEVFGSISENKYFQMTTGFMLLLFAYYSFKGTLPSFLLKLNSINPKADITTTENPFIRNLKTISAGAISALVASPCSTPVLGGVLIMISQTQSQVQGMAFMLAYGLGLSTIFLILGLGIFQIKTLPKSGVWMTYIHKVSVFMLAGSGVYFILKAFSVITV